jgi:TetR/AcrR family transcriptional regulator
LVDAAEHLMVEEGYASVTSRRIGARSGLKPQLVHYYFRSMDELFVEVVRRRAEKNLARFERAVAEDGSLRALWEFTAEPRGAAFTIEVVALANQRKTIRAEIARHAERFRAAQLAALSTALAAEGISAERLPPLVGLLMMTGLAQVMALEDALGVTTGHEEAVQFIESALTTLGERRPAGAGGPSKAADA